MPRKARTAAEDEGPNKGWMESWADAMTLLMAFFVMLFAFALVDETKFYDFKVGMVAALGVSDPVQEEADSILESGNGIALTVGLSTMPTEDLTQRMQQAEEDIEAAGVVTPENAEKIRQLLEDRFEELGATPYVQVGIDERGVFVRYDQRLLFASGSADLGSDSDAILLATNDVLAMVDNPIEIEGHTDNVPTNGRFISNWELSSGRASAVVRWLIDRRQIPPGRLAAVGMADTRPVAPNDSENGRAMNRRVEIVLRVAGIADSDVAVIDPIEDPIGLGVVAPDHGRETEQPDTPQSETPQPDTGETAAGATDQEAPRGEEEG